MSETTNVEWDPEAPLLLTREQVAKLLGVSPRTVNNLLARRELARVKIGSRTLVRRSSIEAFLKKPNHPTVPQKQLETVENNFGTKKKERP